MLRQFSAVLFEVKQQRRSQFQIAREVGDAVQRLSAIHRGVQPTVKEQAMPDLVTGMRAVREVLEQMVRDHRVELSSGERELLRVEFATRIFVAGSA